MSESEQFLSRSLENMKSFIDVNKVIGNPIITEDGRIIIPITEVKLCFLSGGGEYSKEEKEKYPFGGATGGNLSMKPTGFIVIERDEVKAINYCKDNVIESLFNEAFKLIHKLTEKK